MSKKIKGAVKPVVEKKAVEKKQKLFPFRFILVAAVLLIYGSSVKFDFTLDDDLFYLKHKSVQQGLAGIGEIFTKGSLNQFDGSTGTQPYRPLTLTFFALQKDIFQNSPAAAHFMNVLVYALVVLVLYTVLSKLFSNLHTQIVGIICLLFAVHPLHTEVVASVKSADELLAALFGLLAWNEYLKEGPSKWRLYVTGSLFFFLSVLSKESAISFLAIIPLSMWMLKQKKMSDVMVSMIPMALLAGIFLFMRHEAMGVSVQGDDKPIMNNVLHGAKDLAELTATKAEILFHYLRLMIFPWPLNYDYSYNQIPLVGWDNIYALSGALLYAGLFFIALYYFRRQPLLAFCILFFFIASAPTNNIFFINGATVGERFLFVPSLAVCVMIPWWLSKLMKLDLISFAAASKNNFTGILLVLMLIFSGMSFVRSQDWKDGLVLFQKGVERAPHSARAHYNLASKYMDSARHTDDRLEAEAFLQNAVKYFKSSLDIYPKYTQALYNSGICYTLIKDSAQAIKMYQQTIAVDPKYIPAINNLGVIYQSRRNLDSTRYYYEMAYQLNTKAPIAIKNLADLYFFIAVDKNNKGNTDSAIHYYHRSLFFNAANIFVYNNMGSVFSAKSQYDSALYYLKKGYELDNASLMILENLGAVHLTIKNYKEALFYANKAYALQPKSRKAIGILRDTYAAMGNQAEANRFQKIFDSLK